MRIERITDERHFDEATVAGLLKNNDRVVLQFSKPGYAPRVLGELNRLAAHFDERLEIRFYAHYTDGFDCTVLKHLPSVKNLSVDCMRAVKRPEFLHELQHLRALSLGIYEPVPSDFLAAPAFAKLGKLAISESRTQALDLSPLAGMAQLRHLNLTGFHKGIDAIGTLPRLEELILRQIKKHVPLSFVSRIKSLRTFQLILGGRNDISEIAHDGLQTLEIIWVLGFAHFDPAAFPGLKRLHIENQIKLAGIRFSKANAALELVRFLNCKGLRSIEGLSFLRRLKELRIARTAVDCHEILKAGLPRSLSVFAFYTSKRKDNLLLREELDRLGYSEFGDGGAAAEAAAG